LGFSGFAGLQGGLPFFPGEIFGSFFSLLISQIGAFLGSLGLSASLLRGGLSCGKNGGVRKISIFEGGEIFFHKRKGGAPFFIKKE